MRKFKKKNSLNDFLYYFYFNVIERLKKFKKKRSLEKHSQTFLDVFRRSITFKKENEKIVRKRFFF